jgi:hypothetical protein
MMRRRTLGILAAFALACAAAFMSVAVADAQQQDPNDPGTPSQLSEDGSSASPGACAGCIGWGDMVGGGTARPYVVSLSIINGGVSTPVVTNGTTAEAPLVNGGVTTTVSPWNLCAAGQPAQPGHCYSTPNRVGLVVGYGNFQTVSMNFWHPEVPITPTIDANSIIDMTVAMNTLGQSLRWTWVNGDLLYWQTRDLGQPDATVHIKFHPAEAPMVLQWPQKPDGSIDYDVQSSDAQILAASIFFSLDDTLDPAMTGAIFATQNAVAGYVTPGGTAAAPSLDLEMISTHTKPDGSPQLGTMEAFLPSAALLNLYGILPADATLAFATTRLGDPGTNSAATYAPWTAAVNGSDGILATVNNITFSTPKYSIKSKLKPLAAHATSRGKSTTVSAVAAGCSKTSRCFASLYNLGRHGVKRYQAAAKAELNHQTLVTPSLSLTVPATKLRRGSQYLVVVHSYKHHRLLGSATGTVH